MKAFLLAVLAAVAISFGAAVALESFQQSADGAFVGKGARPDPEPKLRGKAGS